MVELHAMAVARAFPLAVTSRTRDVIQMDIDGDRGCSVILTAEAAEIRLPTVAWTCGAYGPGIRAGTGSVGRFRETERIRVFWDSSKLL
jgi:hypothetical protein